MRKFEVVVTQVVQVEIDETKFDDRFMREFRESMYSFENIIDHVGHLAQLEARGIAGDFIEGYGPVEAMGIKLLVLRDRQEEEVTELVAHPKAKRR